MKKNNKLINAHASGQMYKEFEYFIEGVAKGKKAVFMGRGYVVIPTKEYLKMKLAAQKNQDLIDFYKGLRPGFFKRVWKSIFPALSGIRGAPTPRPKPKPLTKDQND